MGFRFDLAVDTALDFDTHFNNAGHFPLAVFKFTSLELAGNPTIDLTNGGVTNLALISVGDITSGLPGGTLTFSGLDALILASQDGSINLGSEITFQGIPTLFFYARGTNGDLTLASPIVGTTDLFLYAGRNITFNAGTDLILGGQFSPRSAGGNISVSESGNISIGESLSATITVESGVTLGGDATINVTAANISTGVNSFGLSLDGLINNATGNIGGNAFVFVNVTNDITAQGPANFQILNNDGGHIGGNADILVATGGGGRSHRRFHFCLHQ